MLALLFCRRNGGEKLAIVALKICFPFIIIRFPLHAYLCACVFCVRCQQVITVMFDRDSEVELSGEPVRPFSNAASAEAWWHRHKLWLLGPNPV